MPFHHHHRGFRGHHHHHHNNGAAVVGGLLAGAAVAGAVGMAMAPPRRVYGAPAPGIVYGAPGAVALQPNQTIVVPGQVRVVQQQAVIQHQVPLVRQVRKFRIRAISVPSFRKDKRGNVLFAIRVTADTGQEWIVEKRYSQLDAWRNTHIRRSDLGWPGKHLFSLSERQIKERRYKLNEWFAQLVIRSAVNQAVQDAIYHLVEFNRMIATIPQPGAVAAADPRGGLPAQAQAQVQAQPAIAQVVSAVPAGSAAPVAAVASPAAYASSTNLNAMPQAVARAAPSAPTYL